jgi:uncharacterized glyoxalase superfamily protein PhnB
MGAVLDLEALSLSARILAVLIAQTDQGAGMPQNRSVPAEAILPHVTYDDLERAIQWLSKALGFAEHYRYGQPVSGAQMSLGRAWIMVNAARTDRGSPARVGSCTQSLTVFVDDVATHFERARTAGCAIVEELHETVYGERQYGVVDIEGHHWLFSQHVRDVDPTEWGARICTYKSGRDDEQRP